MFWVALVAVIVAAGAGVWWKWFQTYHLVTVKEGVLYRTGNRGMREFENTVRAAKPKTVVCLVDDNELADPKKQMFKAEIEWCAANGVKVERIPVKLGGWPTTADVQKFLDIVAEPENQPVMVHCAQGVRRTGMFVAAYQESVEGKGKEQIKKDMPTFGHSRRTVKDIERFVDVYDGKERAVTATLEPSKE
ncbi:MAG TPA: tyrosine-protein phosphatase [Tepidisphaeraceae bacterium]|nr:tyrosine-protein phosphatase [Tepidisphaeraceae bacterium]